jgi:hypothetical protein
LKDDVSDESADEESASQITSESTEPQQSTSTQRNTPTEDPKSNHPSPASTTTPDCNDDKPLNAPQSTINADAIGIGSFELLIDTSQSTPYASLLQSAHQCMALEQRITRAIQHRMNKVERDRENERRDAGERERQRARHRVKAASLVPASRKSLTERVSDRSHSSHNVSRGERGQNRIKQVGSRQLMRLSVTSLTLDESNFDRLPPLP